MQHNLFLTFIVVYFSSILEIKYILSLYVDEQSVDKLFDAQSEGSCHWTHKTAIIIDLFKNIFLSYPRLMSV